MNKTIRTTRSLAPLLLLLTAVAVSGCSRSPENKIAGHIEDLTELMKDNEEEPAEGIEEIRSYLQDNLPDLMEAVGEGLQALDECDDNECRDEEVESWVEALEEPLNTLAETAKEFAEAIEGDDDAQEALEEIGEHFEEIGEAVEAIMEGGGSSEERNAREARAEAEMNLRRLFDSSVSYYDSDHVTATGSIVPPQFPTSYGPTPAEIPCGEAVDVDYEAWSVDTWEALNFATYDATHFSYQYESSGERIGATFTAYAFGDIDCDGELSTFWRSGVVIEGNEIRGEGLQENNPNE